MGIQKLLTVHFICFQACGTPKRDGEAGSQESPDVGVRVAQYRSAAESGMGALYDTSAWYILTYLHLSNKQHFNI